MIKQDDELDRLEEDIRKLKNKYDQFFAGIIKTPPSFERHKVEGFIHELNKQKMRDNTRRFRFNTIMSRFNQFREMWGRKMREKEEGPLDYRTRVRALAEPAAPTPKPAAPRVTSAEDDPYVRVAPGENGDEMRRLFAKISEEQSKLGKPTSLTMDQLAAMVDQQSAVLRNKYNVKAVAFRVETVDGKVKLKAKPIQD
ncbi:MAG: MXAN_5187 C-terminal domain-containing protein [Thermoanaerobaculia bacterium]